MRRVIVSALVLAATVALGRPASAAPPSWYPPLRWLPAAAANFSSGRSGVPISSIVIHATGGSYAGALDWFRDPRSRLSAHYVIRASDGAITQLVAESDTAFQARGFNRQSIGIEHEFDETTGIAYTDTQYRSSATLVCAIVRRYSISVDRAHILGHSEVPNSDHADPGPTWNWGYYMSLVRSCASGIGSAASADLRQATGPAACESSCPPAAGLAFGAEGAQVSLLQWDLAYLGWLAKADVVAGSGHFGGRTLAALRAFQSANGVPATGFYGELSAGALGRALTAHMVTAPDGELSVGANGAAVARLQSALRGLGYMSVVTGYFGPTTRDAVRRFQRDHGIEPIGTYGPLTRMALALELR